MGTSEQSLVVYKSCNWYECYSLKQTNNYFFLIPYQLLKYQQHKQQSLKALLVLFLQYLIRYQYIFEVQANDIQQKLPHLVTVKLFFILIFDNSLKKQMGRRVFILIKSYQPLGPHLYSHNDVYKIYHTKKETQKYDT